ncbi:MAG: hypothetical protein ACRDFS_02010 [Chloroflexota bacterium]
MALTYEQAGTTFTSWLEAHMSGANQEKFISLTQRLKNGDTPPDGCLVAIHQGEVAIPNKTVSTVSGGRPA